MKMEEILEELVQKVIDFHQDNMGDTMRNSYSPKGYIREFATVRLAGPRRSGHSAAIAHVAKDLEDVVILVPYEAQRERLMSRTAKDFRIELFRSGDLEKKLDGDKVNWIFVDNAFFLSQKNLEILVEVLAENADKDKPFGLILVQ